MLDEYKQLYKANADIIPNWCNMSKSELCRLYVKYKEENNELCQNCLSAIIYKFWHTIAKNYSNQGVKVATEEDCYNWLIDSILYVLDKHVWDNPDSDLYQDELGPEKAINTRIASLRANFYVAAKYMKRQLNYTSYSLDSLLENSSDDYYLPYHDKTELSTEFVCEQIKNYFKKKDYFPAFTLDAILNMDLFDYDEELDTQVFNVDKLRKFLTHLDNNYCEQFAIKYNLDTCKVINSLKYVVNMSRDDMLNHIRLLFNKLKHNSQYKDIKEYK